MQLTVVTSSRSEEKIDDAPNVMYVITAQQIRKMGYRSILDLFDSIPGFEYSPSVNLVHPIVRGIQSLEYLTFMVNGHIINNILETNWMYGALNLEAVDHIEIIVGPGGVFYPAETGTAIINLITKHGVSNVVLAGGNQGYVAGSFSVGGDLGSRGYWQVTGGGSAMDGRPGYVQDDSSMVNRDLRARRIVGKYFPSFSLFGTLSYEDWTLDVVHLNQDQTYGQGYQEGAEEAHRWDYVDSIRLANRHDFGHGFSSEASIAVDNKRYARLGTEGKPIFQLDFSQHIYSGEVAGIYHSDQHLVRLGVQAQEREHRHFYTFSWVPGAHDMDFGMGSTYANNVVQIASTVGVGAYLSEKWSPIPQFDVVAALRGDYDTVFPEGERKIYLNPRAALVWKATPKLIFKALYNTSTRMPNAFYGPRNLSWGSDQSSAPPDQWYNTNPTVRRASVLRTVEGQGIFYAGPVRLSANFYKQDLKDFIAWNFPFTNVGDFHSWGFESNVQIHLADKLEANLGFMWLIKNEFVTKSRLLDATAYALAHPGDPTGKNIYANAKGENIGSPKFHGYVGGSYELFDVLTVSGAVRIQARNPYSRTRLDAAGMSVPEEGYTSRTYLDLGLSKDNLFGHGIFLGVFGRNLLNRRRFVGSVEGVFVEEPEGATVMAKLAKGF
jgi:hypothetical protein